MSITLESIVPVQADRDELVQLLNLLNTHWHQNEEAFSNRSLAEWPQWCADQGFRFALLKDLARNLGSTLTYPEGCPGLDQLITALGPAATTAQLLDSLDQELPQFLEGFDQLLQISQEETAALGAQAGGSAKEYIAGHPKVDLAVGVVATTALASGGLGIYAYVRRRARLAQERVDDRAESVAESEVERIRDNIAFIPRNIGNVPSRIRLQTGNDDQYIFREHYHPEPSFSSIADEASSEVTNDESHLEERIIKESTDFLNRAQSEATGVAESELGKLGLDAQSVVIHEVKGSLDEVFVPEEKKIMESVEKAVNSELKDLEAKEVLILENKLKESATDFAENEFEIISE